MASLGGIWRPGDSVRRGRARCGRAGLGRGALASSEHPAFAGLHTGADTVALACSSPARAGTGQVRDKREVANAGVAVIERCCSGRPRSKTRSRARGARRRSPRHQHRGWGRVLEPLGATMLEAPDERDVPAMATAIAKSVQERPRPLTLVGASLGRDGCLGAGANRCRGAVAPVPGAGHTPFVERRAETLAWIRMAEKLMHVPAADEASSGRGRGLATLA
jgi:hypothetical protein